MSQVTVEESIAGAAALLFDFDGPLCDVFAGLSATRVALALKAIACTDVSSEDPLEVLRVANLRCPSEIAASVEDRLVRDEIDAIAVSVAEMSGVRALLRARDRGLPVGIVTNNSAAAVYEFFRLHALFESAPPVVGRVYRRPELMKPHPHVFERMTRILGLAPRDCVLVGDSETDITGARAVGMPCIALANKPGKRARFEAAGAVTVVDDMAEVERALYS